MRSALLALALLAPVYAPLYAQDTPAGLWDATLTVDAVRVPFRMEFQGSGAELKGALLDGEKRIWSTQGSLREGQLSLRWDFFDSGITAAWKDGAWQGEYVRRTRAGLVKRGFTARPYQAAPAAGKADANLAGHWILKTDSASRANVMEAVFRQSGAEITGTVQRVDGDFGVLEGKLSGTHAVLSHFDGIRATLIEIDIAADGTLKGIINGKQRFTAAKADQAAAHGLPQPPDPARYTSVKDPSVPFAFRFQDLDGHWVANTDERFRNKVVLVTLTGSWCPNCHDEAPMLADLYRAFHSKGLEIVALGFEYTGEVERDREQLRAFARRHNLPYTILLAGTTEDGEIERKLPQIQSFGAFPTTFFLGRDGRVRAVHAGFAGPANPEQHEHLVRETRELVERLLSE
jgi:peroxiredoxin